MVARQSGNVLFLILIAVALFAALSYVVVQSSRSGSGAIASEKDRLAASEIFNYVTAVQSGLLRLQLSGCKENQISFSNPVDDAAAIAESWAKNYMNPNAPADHSCDIFHPNGANVIRKNVPESWSAMLDPSLLRFWYTTGDAIQNVGTTCGTSECTELNINIWGIKPGLCAAINEKLGYHDFITNLPTDALYGCPFSGEYACNGGALQTVHTDARLSGKLMVCYLDTNFGPTFNAVLHTR